MDDKLRTYGDFLVYAERVGVLAFSTGMPKGFPSLGGLTDGAQWHTGDPDTDPWQWKDKVAAEKKLAFGCILGGHKGFVSKKLYPLFYCALRPSCDIEERYNYGEVTCEALSVWELISSGKDISTFEIRTALKSVSQSRLDRAVVSLQREYYITVSGNRRKTNAKGEEYGWPSNTYSTVDSWTKDWLSVGQSDRYSAREDIVSHCLAVNPIMDEKELRKVLFGRAV